MFKVITEKWNISLAHIIAALALVVTVIFAIQSVVDSHKMIDKTIQQNEEIQLKLAKTKTQSDLRNALSAYQAQSYQDSKEFYERQSYWLNFWLVVIGILLALITLITPFKYASSVKQIKSEGEGILRDFRKRSNDSLKNCWNLIKIEIMSYMSLKSNLKLPLI